MNARTPRNPFSSLIRLRPEAIARRATPGSSFSKTNRKPLLQTAGLAALAAASAMPVQGQSVISYDPDQTGTVSAPVVGLGDTSSDYLLTNQFGTSFLDKNFDGNNQETSSNWEEGNPTNAQDAASFDDNYMFQLGTDDNVSKVSLANGSIDNSFSIFSGGANSFGIGYDANSNAIGIGLFDNGTMTFKEYDLGTNTLTDLTSFAFDTSSYGNPTGLDYTNGRMIVGTENQQDDKFAPILNYILDMDSLTGNIDQYATISGSTNKLQDVLYEDGRLATSFDRGTSGLVQVADFLIVPEDRSFALLLGLCGLAATLTRRGRLSSH